MLDRLFSNVWFILLPFTALVIFFGSQLERFEINASADTLIAENNPDYVRTQQINQRFQPEEFLMLAYVPQNGNVFSTNTLAMLEKISERILQLERVESVRSVLNVPLLSKADSLGTNLNPQDYTQNQLQLQPEELARIFKGHPIYEDLIINAEQTTTGIQILFKDHPELKKLNRRIVEIQTKTLSGELSDTEKQQLYSLQQQAAPIEKNLRDTRNREIDTLRNIITDYEDQADIYLGGAHVLGYQLINIIKHDLMFFGGTIAAVICIMILLLFRRLIWVVITASCCAASLIITVGAFGLLGLKATVISSNFISLQLILTLAIVIHLIVQYQQNAAANSDASQRKLVIQSLREKLAPCFFAAITTSVGFASLLLSDIKPVSAFGWMMIVAMGVTVVCTLLLFPALLLLFSRSQATEPHSLFSKPIDALHSICQRHGGLVMILSGAVLAFSLLGASRLDVENSFINYFSEDTQVHRELSFIDRHFGGSTPLDIIYTPPAADKSEHSLVLNAIDVQNTQRIQTTLETMPAVGTTLSLVNFTQLAKEINDNKALTEYELTAIYQTLDRNIRENLIGSFFEDSPAQLRVSARIKDSLENLDRKELLTTIRKEIEALGIAPDNYQLSNLFVLYQAMLEQLFTSQILTLGAVFAVLLLAFLIVFRSLPIALVAMTPNIIAAFSVLGVMGWFNIPLDFMTMTIAAIAMGIAVDDTIHYTHRYIKESKQHTSDTALKNSHHSVGYALVYTTTIIATGFGLLVFSDFVPSLMFGLLTSLSILIALLADLTLLPVLLHRFVNLDQKSNTTQ